MLYPFLNVCLTIFCTRFTQVLRVLVEREASWSWIRSWMDCEGNTSVNTARSVDLIRAGVHARLIRVKVEQTNRALPLIRRLEQIRRSPRINPIRACIVWRRITCLIWPRPKKKARYSTSRLTTGESRRQSL